MTDLRTAAQLALEALEADCGGRCNAEYNPCWQRQMAEALKAALAEPVKQCMAHGECFGGECIYTSLPQGPAKPVQGPDHTYTLIGCVQHDCEECQRRTQRPAEPVGVVTSMVKGGVTWQRWPADMPDGTRLFSEVQP